MYKFASPPPALCSIHTELMLRGDPHVWLDISHKPSKQILHHFPNIAGKVRGWGEVKPGSPALRGFCGARLSLKHTCGVAGDGAFMEVCICRSFCLLVWKCMRQAQLLCHPRDMCQSCVCARDSKCWHVGRGAARPRYPHLCVRQCWAPHMRKINTWRLRDPCCGRVLGTCHNASNTSDVDPLGQSCRA